MHDRRWYCYFPHLKKQIFFLIKNCGKNMIVPTCIVLTTDKEMRELNYRFRGKNRATNVLTFPSCFNKKHIGGDIVIALQTLTREAHQMNRSPMAHFTHLLIHGILHLNGYDHFHPAQARQMEMREASLMRRMRFPNPWK